MKRVQLNDERKIFMETVVIFDMDGVLIDSQPLHYEIDMTVLNACGLQATIDMVVPYTGVSNPDRWPQYKEKMGLSESVERLIELQEMFMREIFNASDLVAIEGIPELLQTLKHMSVPRGVASSSSHELIQMVLERVGIKEYFDIIISGEDVKNGKPAPDIYLKAAKAFDLPPENCIAIEDSPAGMLSAKNAGMICFAYRNPNTYGQVFTHADYTIDKYSEVANIIKGRLK